MSDKNIEEFEHGFLSYAQWEEFCQYVIFKNFNGMKAVNRHGYSAEREVSEHFFNTEKDAYTKGRIDLVLRRYGRSRLDHQIAIEFKVETQITGRFAGKTVGAALQSDYNKLEERFHP